MIEFTTPGRTKVVRSYEVDGWTQNGWRIVAMFQEESTTTHMEGVQEDLPASDGYNTVNCHRFHPKTEHETTTFFVIAQDVDSTIAEMSAKLDELQSSNADFLDEQKRLQELARNRGREIDRLDSDLKSSQQSRIRDSASIAALRESLDMMETDIAKLRKHFGEKAINEALAEE